MKITVIQTFDDAGGVSFAILGSDSTKKDVEIYTAYIGKPDKESYEWACAMAGIYVKGVLMDNSPFTTNKRNGQ